MKHERSVEIADQHAELLACAALLRRPKTPSAAADHLRALHVVG